MSRFSSCAFVPLSLSTPNVLPRHPRQLAFWIRLSPPFCQGVHHWRKSVSLHELTLSKPSSSLIPVLLSRLFADPADFLLSDCAPSKNCVKRSVLAKLRTTFLPMSIAGLTEAMRRPSSRRTSAAEQQQCQHRKKHHVHVERLHPLAPPIVRLPERRGRGHLRASMALTILI